MGEGRQKGGRCRCGGAPTCNVTPLAVRKLLPKTICYKEGVQSAVKTYADVTKESQKKIIEEASLTQSSKTVVENVVRKLDADKIEREKRKLNAVVLKVPEL